jgi:transcriptional regulator with XRE-family HTH domain
MNDRQKFFDNFKYNLRVFRVSKGISGKEMCDALGWSDLKKINTLEDPNKPGPKMEDAYKIAQYLNISIDDMIKKRATVKVYFEPTVTYRDAPTT